jgi:hypothetical protein
VVAVTAVIVVLSYRPVRNLLSKRQLMNSSFNALRLVNTYGAFGSVTKERLEVIVEGSDDGVEWREYEFKGKPGNPRRRPPQVAPYHLRLDWLMWFLALPGRFDDRWFSVLLVRLLENDRPTLRLLRTNPFPDAPPAMVRARLFRYRFTSRQERRQTGDWWVRTPVREIVRPVRLEGRSLAP